MSETFLPLSVPVLAGREWDYVKDCLDSGWVSSAGSYVERFEERLCALLGAPHAVALVNGTAGLHMALLAAGVRPGDRVVVPTLTFIATANAVRHAGAEPVFVDCDEFMNIDVGRRALVSRRGLRAGPGRPARALQRRARAGRAAGPRVRPAGRPRRARARWRPSTGSP